MLAVPKDFESILAIGRPSLLSGKLPRASALLQMIDILIRHPTAILSRVKVKESMPHHRVQAA